MTSLEKAMTQQYETLLLEINSLRRLVEESNSKTEERIEELMRKFSFTSPIVINTSEKTNRDFIPYAS